MKNYYEILEVHPKASEEIIKKIYKLKIKQNHPDLFQGEEKTKAEEITKELTEAYNVLSNEEKRKNYDLELNQNEADNSTNITKQYENIISSLKSENEYLKNILSSKNELINNFLEDKNIYQASNSEQNIQPDYINTKYYNQNQNIPEQKNNYFRYILYDLKQIAFKIISLIVFFGTLILILSILTKNNFFKAPF